MAYLYNIIQREFNYYTIIYQRQSYNKHIKDLSAMNHYLNRQMSALYAKGVLSSNVYVHTALQVLGDFLSKYLTRRTRMKYSTVGTMTWL